jgi:hypothetical protein
VIRVGFFGLNLLVCWDSAGFLGKTAGIRGGLRKASPLILLNRSCYFSGSFL